MRNKKVKDLMIGDVIRIEYGDYDNFVNFEVDQIIHKGDKTEVVCHKGAIEETFVFDSERDMECL